MEQGIDVFNEKVPVLEVPQQAHIEQYPQPEAHRLKCPLASGNAGGQKIVYKNGDNDNQKIAGIKIPIEKQRGSDEEQPLIDGIFQTREQIVPQQHQGQKGEEKDIG